MRSSRNTALWVALAITVVAVGVLAILELPSPPAPQVAHPRVDVLPAPAPLREEAREPAEPQGDLVRIEVLDLRDVPVHSAVVYAVGSMRRAYHKQEVLVERAVSSTGIVEIASATAQRCEYVLASAPGFVTASARLADIRDAVQERLIVLRMVPGETLAISAQSSDGVPIAKAGFLISQVPPDASLVDGDLATVAIPGPARELAVYTAVTNEQGQAQVSGLSPGPYFLTPTDPGIPWSGPSAFSIAPGRATELRFVAGKVYAVAVRPVGCQIAKVFLAVASDERPDAFKSCRSWWQSKLANRLGVSVDHVFVVVIAAPERGLNEIQGTLAVWTRFQGERRLDVMVKAPDDLTAPIDIYEVVSGPDSVVRVSFDCRGERIDEEYKRDITFVLCSTRPLSGGDPGHRYQVRCGESVDVMKGDYSLLTTPIAHMASLGIRPGHRLTVSESGPIVFDVKRRIVTRRLRVIVRGVEGFGGPVNIATRSSDRSEKFIWKAIPAEGVLMGFFEGETGTLLAQIDGLPRITVPFSASDAVIRLEF